MERDIQKYSNKLEKTSWLIVFFAMLTQRK
jgi:hypothetical protein